jgi:hypothetical protein
MPQHDKEKSGPAKEPKLTPGVAFHLQPDGSWSPEKLPSDVLTDAKFSGYLTIDGYRCSVFETPDKSMWAQKSVNTPATVSSFSKASRSMDSVASRVAAAWLAGQRRCSSCRDFAFHGPEQAAVEYEGGVHHPACPILVAARADDLVSQVNDILHGGGWSQEDQQYDADIVAWCEKAQKKIPEMQEIFDTAFHEVMDFKGKIPVSDNPRVRQIADEKVAEMLNQAAARLEIISHGLVQEVRALCEGLAKGANIMPEAPTGETQQSQQASSPQATAQELLSIANAIDASKNPDRELVAYDLRRLLASL